MTTRPRLSIVLVTHNSRDDVDVCLRSLAEHPPRMPYEIVLVDSASSDGTLESVRERWPDVRAFDAGGNVGFARGNNIGIRESVGELVLLLNPDTIVAAGSIDTLIDALDRHPGVAAAGPRLVDGNARAELSFGAMISPLAELRQKILVRGHDRGIGPISALVERMTRRTKIVDWVSGACLLARRRALDEAGLFDERFFLYMEDVDLCASIRARGYGILFVAEAVVTHLRGRSSASDPGAPRAEHRRSRMAFYEKHHTVWARALRALWRG